MKKYLLIISCVWVSMSVAAVDMSSDVRAGDGQVTVTQRASTVDAQGQAVDANETSANTNSSSVGGTSNSRNDYSMVKPAVNTTLTPNTSIINGWGGRNHTPIKPGDEECDGTKLMSSSSHPTGVPSVSDIINTVKNKLQGEPMGDGGRVPTPIRPVINPANQVIQIVGGKHSTLKIKPDNGTDVMGMGNGSTSTVSALIDRGRNSGIRGTLGVGGRLETRINPIGGGKGTRTGAGTCRTFTPSESEDSGDQGDILSKVKNFDDFLKNRDKLIVILGGGGRKETPISPFSLPNPVIPTVLSGSKGSIEKVTNMIDDLLTNRTSEGVSLEDVTSMIDMLLVK